MSAIRRVVVLLAIVFTTESALADHFTIRGPDGKTIRLEARLVGSGEGQHALETDDGRIRLVPQGAVVKRETADGPEPITPDTMLNRLQEQFGESFYGLAEGHFVIGLITSGALPDSANRRADTSLKRAAKFMRGVEKTFLAFTRRMKIPTEPPTHPLVLLIFETDDDFESYHRAVSGGTGLSSGNVAGFYSPLTNWLVIRMTECLTFETPLHEAIHQQVFNQHVLKRLAPTPAWFNEGIATGFEGNGDRISRGPARVSVRYSRLAGRARRVQWPTLVGSDDAFRGDIFAGDAYTHAWCMHWLLVTKYKDEYAKYVKLIGAKEPLAESTPVERRRDLEQTIGKQVQALQSEFPRALSAALRRQRLPAEEKKPTGVISVQENLADLKLATVMAANGQLRAEGTIRNISTIRPMTFHVLAVTNAGQYAEWLFPNLGVGREVRLAPQSVERRLAGARGGLSRTFSVRVSAAPPDSEEAKRWAEGKTPLPRIRR